MKKLFLVIALSMSLLAGCTRVGAGHVGVVVNNAGSQRGVSDFTPTTGWVWYIPGKTSVFEYPTYIQNVVWTASKTEGHPVDESITFTNRDKMSVSMDINLAYRLTPEKVPAFYIQFRNDNLKDFTDGFMRNQARDCINEQGGRFAIEDIMGDNAPFLKESRNCLQDKLGPYGVVIEQFGIIGAPRPPQSVIDAINSTIQAKQIALQKTNEVVQAQADANKAVAQAEGQAKVKITLAEAEAKSNQVLSSSLTSNLLEWRKLNIQEQAVQRWNGQRPSVEGQGSGLLLQVH